MVVVTGCIDVNAMLTRIRNVHRDGRTRAVETQVHVRPAGLRNEQGSKQNYGQEPGQHDAAGYAGVKNPVQPQGYGK